MKTHQTVDNSKGQISSNSAASHAAGNTSAIQLIDNRPGSVDRYKQADALARHNIVQKQANNTGLPDQLKSGIENLSGHSVDDVKVHYNSDKPAQLHAHAYAQGADIHLAPGQEKHLPHEAWHVVQQKQGRVRPTMQMKSKVNINDNRGLEKEADVMGQKALQMQRIAPSGMTTPDSRTIQRFKGNDDVVQRIEDDEIEANLNEIEKNKNFDIRHFLAWQEQITEVKTTYRTMGPEFEFAKLAANIPLHVELVTSTTRINGLPFVIETDAGNVIELACPPFVVGTTLEDWEKAKLRSMIITDRFEKILKGEAAAGASSGEDLKWLLKRLEGILGTGFDETEQVRKIGSEKLTLFTKGIKDYSNEFVSGDMVTNSQINIKTTTQELAMALRKGVKGFSSHQFLKGLVTFQLFKELRAFQGGDMEKYRNRVAIISYFISQIPLMAFQYIMNAVRDVHKNERKETREENRDNFRAKHKNNQKLLIRLSTIKDFMGFWVKASLNDMIKDDPEIGQMVLAISPQNIGPLLIRNSIKSWMLYKEGLEAYAGRDLTGFYGSTMAVIVFNMRKMALMSGAIQKPKKLEFPRFTSEGHHPNELLDYAHGAPFMARPDTYVPLQDGHLVEVRGLNKKIANNSYMKGFQMPYYRLFDKLATQNSPSPYKKEDAEKIKEELAKPHEERLL